MQVRRTPIQQKRPRSGFTLIELLVVISIIAVLAALILPGIQNAREAARRAQCMSQMRNVNMAFHTYATAHNGQLPYLMTAPPGTPGFSPTAALDFDASDTNRTTNPSSMTGLPWTVLIMPHIEQQGLFDRLSISSNVSSPGPNSTDGLLLTNIQTFTCPDDGDAEANGNLSFVVNAGYTTAAVGGTPGGRLAQLIAGNNGTHTIGDTGSGVAGYDWSFNGYNGVQADDQDVTKAGGVFFQQYLSGGFHSSLDHMATGDGGSQTVVMTENLQAEDWGKNKTNPSGIASAPRISGLAFVVPLADTGTTGQVMDGSQPNGVGPNPGLQNAALSYGTLNYSSANAPFGTSWINSLFGTAPEGQAPRPSSFHPGTVNCAFGDGHCDNISQTIDYSVWVRLVSPRGNRMGQNILSDSSF